MTILELRDKLKVMITEFEKTKNRELLRRIEELDLKIHRMRLGLK